MLDFVYIKRDNGEMKLICGIGFLDIKSCTKIVKVVDDQSKEFLALDWKEGAVYIITRDILTILRDLGKVQYEDDMGSAWEEILDESLLPDGPCFPPGLFDMLMESEEMKKNIRVWSAYYDLPLTEKSVTEAMSSVRYVEELHRMKLVMAQCEYTPLTRLPWESDEDAAERQRKLLDTLYTNKFRAMLPKSVPVAVSIDHKGLTKLCGMMKREIERVKRDRDDGEDDEEVNALTIEHQFPGPNPVSMEVMKQPEDSSDEISFVDFVQKQMEEEDVEPAKKRRFYAYLELPKPF